MSIKVSPISRNRVVVEDVVSNNNIPIVGRIWTAFLPKRGMSYFILHCGIFVTTLAFFCLDNTLSSSFPKSNLRSKGGIILTFASTSAIVQMTLLHVIPHSIMILHTHNKKTDTNGVTTNRKTTTTVATSIIGIMEGCLHYLSLTLLFVMEILILWLIFGQCIFLWSTTTTTTTTTTMITLIMKPTYLGLILLTATAVYHYNYFHLYKKENDVSKNNDVTKKENTQKDYIVLCEESTHLLPLITKDKVLNYNDKSSNADFSEIVRANNPILDDQTAWYGYFAGTSSYHVPLSSIKKRKSSRSSNEGSSGNVQTIELNRYISTLQLSFDILVITCMFVLVQKCSPIIMKLWANGVMMETKKHHLLWPLIGWSGIFILLITWCSYKNGNSRSRGNIHLWTGNMGRNAETARPNLS